MREQQSSVKFAVRATVYAFYTFYAWWIYFPQSGVKIMVVVKVTGAPQLFFMLSISAFPIFDQQE
jgi:hypothetical protein